MRYDREAEFEARRMERNQARAPRAFALHERLRGAVGCCQRKDEAMLVGLLATVGWYTDHGVEIPQSQVDEVERCLAACGMGPFPAAADGPEPETAA